MKAGGGKPMTMGEMIKTMLTRLEWYETRWNCKIFMKHITKYIPLQVSQDCSELREGHQRET